MTTATATDKRRQLLRDGFCLFEGILDCDLLKQTRKISDALLDGQPPEHFEQQKSTGSMISVFDDPAFAELVRCPAAIAALGSLGFPHPKWWSGFVISKPPQSPPLFWHQDWWGWNHPVSYDDPVPQQVFLMYYTVDTAPGNGCLRLIPGSHLIRHRLHDAVPDPHTDALREMEDPRSLVYQTVDEAVDVPVRAGDLVDRGLAAAALGARQRFRATPHRHHPVVLPGLRCAARVHPDPHRNGEENRCMAGRCARPHRPPPAGVRRRRRTD